MSNRQHTIGFSEQESLEGTGCQVGTKENRERLRRKDLPVYLRQYSGCVATLVMKQAEKTEQKAAVRGRNRTESPTPALRLHLEAGLRTEVPLLSQCGDRSRPRRGMSRRRRLPNDWSSSHKPLFTGLVETINNSRESFDFSKSFNLSKV